MILPFKLSTFYPNPFTINLFSPEYTGSLIILLGLSCYSFRHIKRHRFLSATWTYHLLTLIPVIGFVQVGGQPAAARYAYLPSVGPFILACSAIGVLVCKHSKKFFKLSAIFSLLLLSISFGSLTVKQISVWRDSITLWSHAIKLSPKLSYLAFTKRGAHLNTGNYSQAIKDLDEALDIYTGFINAYYYRGRAYQLLKRHRNAISDFSIVIESNSGYPGIYNS